MKTRRQGLIAAAVTALAVVTGKARAKETSSGQGGTMVDLTFDLDDFRSVTFSHGAETVTLTPREIMAALKAK